MSAVTLDILGDITIDPHIDLGETVALTYGARRFVGPLIHLDGNHGPETNLYYCKNSGAATLLDRGVLDFGLGDGFIAYAKDSAIYAYRFADNKSYRITPERESVQFLGVSDGKVLWMDVTTRERDIVKFAPIP